MRPKIVEYSPDKRYKYAHLKRDGIWVTLFQQTPLSAVALTRHPTDVADQLRSGSNAAFLSFELVAPVNAQLFCELFAPGQPASEVKSLLASGRASELSLESFATPMLPDDAELAAVRAYSEALRVPFNAHWRRQDVSYVEDWWRKYDGEGVVFKNGNLLDWAKYKPTLTADLIVTGFKDGRGKYVGKVGSVECSLADGTVVAYVGGMTDETRDELSADREAFLGRVVEVAYQRVEARGGLRHPRWVRLRDDKRAEECDKI